MTFRKLTIEGECPEHGEWQVFVIVPEHVTAEDVMFTPEEADIFCECYHPDNADLIVSLLNGRRLN